jgi:hypothetical protein
VVLETDRNAATNPDSSQVARHFASHVGVFFKVTCWFAATLGPLGFRCVSSFAASLTVLSYGRAFVFSLNTLAVKFFRLI